MAEFKIRTKGNSDHHGKARVYFTCHPDDFDEYFDDICEDVFKTQDCAIYYTADMNEIYDADNLSADLVQSSIFLVPVTFKLMNEPCRAMQVDIPFAKKANIMILPFMMESGIDELYALPKNFGAIQYLSPNNNDSTMVNYTDKLEKILETVLISDTMAERIRAAFDAYVFLSYRKKDRKYANELMRVIHAIPGCRDIAIWYDEFLTPGELFTDNIAKAMKKSQLFALLVTPNLLEEGNFVMSNEYPEAKKNEIPILPAEMVVTDRKLLKDKFREIPDCVDPFDDGFGDIMRASLSRVAVSESESLPEHTFLVGLAYLDGIDVEVNVERGIELITSAADRELPEAMIKLCHIYFNGYKVAFDYKEALKWAERFYKSRKQEYGEEDENTLDALDTLAYVCLKSGDFKTAGKLYDQIDRIKRKTLDEDDPEILKISNGILYAYTEMGDYKKALEIGEKVYLQISKKLGEDHLDSLMILNNLATIYNLLGNYRKAHALYKKAYTLSSKKHGDDHEDTLKFLSGLANVTGKLGAYDKELEYYEKIYAIRRKAIGDEHKDTLITRSSIASAYQDLHKEAKALEIAKDVHRIQVKRLGEKHPDTLATLGNIAIMYGEQKKYKEALAKSKEHYDLMVDIYGEKHPLTLSSLRNHAVICCRSGDFKKAVKLNKKAHSELEKVLGEKHPDTLRALESLGSAHRDNKDYKIAFELLDKLYTMRVGVFGPEHPDTLSALHNLAIAYEETGKPQKALELFEKAYASRCKMLGEEHPDTQFTMKNLVFMYGKFEKHDKVMELFGKMR